MPTPFTPPLIQFFIDLRDAVEANTLAVQALQADIDALAEDAERTANFQRYMLESTFGATPAIEGMWDGSDRYPEIP